MADPNDIGQFITGDVVAYKAPIYSRDTQEFVHEVLIPIDQRRQPAAIDAVVTYLAQYGNIPLENFGGMGMMRDDRFSGYKEFTYKEQTFLLYPHKTRHDILVLKATDPIKGNSVISELGRQLAEGAQKNYVEKR
jgi:hypothetical protein